MYSVRQPNQDSPEVQRLRQEGGAWLRSLREVAGLSQRELAARVGLEYYSFVSQIETGKGRIPTHQIKAWAEALSVSPKHLATNLMRFYDPTNYALIFGDDVMVTPANDSEPSLQARVERLEKLLGEKP